MEHANAQSHLDFDPAYFQREIYGGTKALLLLFALHLAHKLEQPRATADNYRKVVVVSTTPGVCRTRILANIPKDYVAFTEMIGWPVEDGARAIVSCALEDKMANLNGKYVASGLVVR